MAEIRVQIAYHFKINPSDLLPGQIRLPEQITRTVSVGEELITEKVATETLPSWDRETLHEQLDKQCREATRTARPAGSAPAATAENPADIQQEDEISAF